MHDWLAPFVHRWLHGLDHLLGAGNPFATAIGIGIVVAAFALLALGAVLLVRSLGRPPRRSRVPGAGAAIPAAEQNAVALLAAARAAARVNRYRDAAALLFRSAAYALDERGRLTFDPARTAGEYRRLVRDPLFDAFAGDAVVAVFAPAEPPRELFERMNATYERLFDAPAR